MNLLGKILATVIGTVFVVFAVLTVVNIYQTKNLTIETAQKMAQAETSDHAYQIQLQLDYAMDTARTLAANLTTMVEEQKADRALTDAMFQRILKNNEQFMGVWSVWEPNAFDGQDEKYINTERHDASGRYVPFWTRDGDSIVPSPIVDYDTSDFYLLPKQKGQEMILEPFVYPVAGKDVLLTSIIVPVTIDNEFKGIVAVDMSLETFAQLSQQVKLFDSGYGSIISNNGMFVTHPNKDYVTKPFAEQEQYTYRNEIQTAIQQGKASVIQDFSSYLQEDSYIVTAPIHIGKAETPWSLLVTVPTKEVLAQTTKLTWTMVIIGVAGLIYLLIVLTWLIRRIVRPIVMAVAQVQAIADGNLAVEPLAEDSKDELGHLAKAVNIMTSNTRTLIQEARQISNQASTYSDRLMSSTNNMSVSIDQVLTTTGELATGATLQAEHAALTLGVTQEVEQKLQAIQVAIKEMTHRSQETTQASKQGLVHAEQSIQGMEAMSEQVTLTASVVQQLSDQSTEINRILQVINAIAGQTDLLALNAAIEAARAGEHGKGFSVVAEEVRKLAEESAKSTNQIAAIIDTVVKDTVKAGDAMQNVVAAVQTNTQYLDANKQALDAILQHINDTVAQIDEVTTASHLIQKETVEVVRAVENMTAVSQQSSAGTEELLATMEQQNTAVHELKNMAESLSGMTNSLQQTLAKFHS
ncbi:methyl-accepting chemotaxis protein [Lysinibacillus sp. OL1_EC]|uniref:methyl-accepting chemotaxis protein n=1 Tax=unclassified Lysinibacillus TaxID=2636778 RepID=UPI00103F60AA|nr:MULTISPECIES: methyl-accepting chemotaxis protein [unclassified Lysinibacillus]MCM0624224.1 methyl-accepting chemotaxis protein [Lysinibacillus sp. OL1_EC]TBV88501.1 methyl-accepting chemotaxis protein [Lysinibacillus sp. OL1]WGT37371.1 methyl-accepting chemotaxis protein [Lysinibacillus sp. 1 U-2021]